MAACRSRRRFQDEIYILLPISFVSAHTSPLWLHNPAAACPHTLFPQRCTCGLNNLRQLLPYHLRTEWHSVSRLSWTVIYGFLPVLTAITWKYAGISGSILISVTQQVLPWNSVTALVAVELLRSAEIKKNDKYAWFSFYFGMLLYMMCNTRCSVSCYRCRQSYPLPSCRY